MSKSKAESDQKPSNNQMYDNDGRNAFLRAAHDGDKQQVELLLRSKPQSETIDSRDNEGNTALHLACKYGHVAVIAFIFSFYQDKEQRRKLLSIRDNQSKTCIDKAVDDGQLEVIHFIIRDIKNDHHYSPQYLYVKTFSNATKMRSINTLDLSRLDIYDEKFKRIVPTIVNADIKSISLNHNYLTSESDEQLVKIVTQSKTLKKLDLSHNSLGKKSFFSFSSPVQQIAKALAKNKSTLEDLLLTHCELTDSDLEALTMMLKKNHTLKRLDIRNNPEITPKAIKELVRFLEKTQITLTRLKFDSNDEQLRQRIEKVFRDKRVGEKIEASVMQPQIAHHIALHENGNDIFLQALGELRQALSVHQVDQMDAETKQDLMRKKQAGRLTEQEAFNLFVSLLDEEEQNYRNSRSKLYKNQTAFNEVKAHLGWLLESNSNEEITKLNALWESKLTKYQVSIDGIENSAIENLLKDIKERYAKQFEMTFQRKLSMYWLAVNCLDTKLIKDCPETDRTMKRFETLLSLVTLIPMLSVTNQLAHGAIGLIVHLYHALQELIEATHLVHFVSHLPVAHQALHHLAKKWEELGKTPSEEKMLENIQEGFETLEICHERALVIAKAIWHRYEEASQPDTLKDIENLAAFTAVMVIDFYRVGIYKEPEYSHFKSEEEHQKALLEGILDWLFFAGKFFYEKEKQPFITIQGHQYKATDYYCLPGIALIAKDNQEQEMRVECDFVIQDEKGKELIKTDSPKMKHRKGSRGEARELSRHLATSKAPSQANQEVKREQKRASHVKFDEHTLEQYKEAKDIREIQFVYLTKGQRLQILEGKVLDLKNKVADLIVENGLLNRKIDKIEAGYQSEITTLKEEIEKIRKNQLESSGDRRQQEVISQNENQKENVESREQNESIAEAIVRQSTIYNNTSSLKQEEDEESEQQAHLLS